jgi:hypothetical protein
MQVDACPRQTMAPITAVIAPPSTTMVVPAMVADLGEAESARTTKLYDRRNDQVTLDQVERIVL